MTDRRERPQYGEYATPDEQVAAGGYAVEPAPVVSSTSVTSTGHSQPLAQPFAQPHPATRIAGAPPAPRTWDVALTVAFLVFGAYSVVSSIPGLLDFGATLKQLYRLSGYGEYTQIDLANGIGIGILVSQSVLFVATVVVTMARLRARKIAFFVPLIGGVVSGVVIFVLMLIAITMDPAFAATLGSTS